MNYFGHQHETKAILVALMDFFSRIYIEKYGSIETSGEEQFISRKIIPVPVQWAAKDKWIEIYRSSSAKRSMDPSINNKNPVEFQWILPRISVELKGLSYDSERRLIKTQKITNDFSNPSSASRNFVFTPVPYNLNVVVTTISKYLDDNFQIMEQIVPYFGPSLNLDVKILPNKEPDSIPIILESVDLDIPTDIAETDERLFTFTYSFQIKTNYYLQKRLGKPIYQVDSNLILNPEVINIKQIGNPLTLEIDNRFTYYSQISEMPNPFNININSNW